MREFDRAVADLERADALVAGKPDEVEPDGQPNPRNIPLTTLQSNIRYHLALAYYLEGDYAKAAPVWQRARDAVKNPDNLVSATHWLYLTLWRLARSDEAARALDAIAPGLDVIENASYYSLCQMYKGTRTADDVLEAAGTGPSGAAVVYGVSAWHAIHGRRPRRARSGSDSSRAGLGAFGVIAAKPTSRARNERLTGRVTLARAARSGPPLRRRWDCRGRALVPIRPASVTQPGRTASR